MSLREWFNHRVLRSALLSLAGVAVAASAVTAQSWNEQGDAGDLPASAQVTVGTGQLLFLYGLLSNVQDVDMYCIRVVNSAAFVANFQCAVHEGPVPYLFDASGAGVETNETCAGGFKQLTSTYVGAPGIYYLAVAHYGRTATSSMGSIWLSGVPGLRTPDGPGAAFPVTGWAGSPVLGPINPYAFALAGCEPCLSPVATEPGTWGKVKALYR